MSEEGASEATPATRLQLEVVAGNAAGSTIDLEERVVFGRQSEGPGKLADDPELSRHHAEVTRRPTGEYQLEDLSSTNGTYVNGTRLQAPVVLALGDAIELGTTKLLVRASPAATAPAAGAVDVRAATVVVDVPAEVRAPQEQPAAPPPTTLPPTPPRAPTPAVPPTTTAPPASPPSPTATAPPTPSPSPTPPAPPTPPPAPPPPPPPPPLELRLRVDLEHAEAEIALGEGQSVRLRLQEGRWQIVDGSSQ